MLQVEIAFGLRFEKQGRCGGGGIFVEVIFRRVFRRKQRGKQDRRRRGMWLILWELGSVSCIVEMGVFRGRGVVFVFQRVGVKELFRYLEDVVFVSQGLFRGGRLWGRRFFFQIQLWRVLLVRQRVQDLVEFWESFKWWVIRLDWCMKKFFGCRVRVDRRESRKLLQRLGEEMLGVVVRIGRYFFS